MFGCFYLVDMIACTTTTPMNMNSAQIRPSLKEGSGLCWYSPSCCLLKCIKIGLKSSLGFFIDLKELQEKCKLLLHELNSFAIYEYRSSQSDAHLIFARVTYPRYCKLIIFSIYDIERKIIFQQNSVDFNWHTSECAYS